MRTEFCASCGAPLEARWSEIVIKCSYCGCENIPGKRGEPVPSSIPDDGRTRLAVGGRTYMVQGLLGTGDSSHVYRGRWVRRLGELVVLKVLRCPSDADLMRREWAFLGRLQNSSARGSDHFVNRLPSPIATGPVRVGDEERLVSVFQWRSGFQHTLEDVKAVHTKGVGAPCAVWIFKRLLEFLGWAHESGVVHGAVLPPHVLVHPRDHGAMLVGWTTATAWSAFQAEPLPALSRAWKTWYPDDARKGREVKPATDITMAARCVLWAAGASGFDRGGTLPRALAKLFVSASHAERDDAWGLCEEISRVSLDALGPPAYSPIRMPGWPAPPR
jgi:serine/threonine protein kinase